MRIQRIDHVHIEVSDRETAADWCEQTLGLKRHENLANWAKDPMGPLILKGGDGYPTLSLFARDCKEPTRDSTVAFRVDGESFLEFCDRLDALELYTKSGRLLTCADIVDHELSWSLYFVDLDLSRNCSAPLTWYFAAKEKHHGTETNPRVPRRSSAHSVDQRAAA